VQAETGVQQGREETSRETSVTGTGASPIRDGFNTTVIPVVDRRSKPLQPTHPARIRIMRKQQRTRVVKAAPFVVRVVDRNIEDSVVPGVELGIDPGSKHTGISVFSSKNNVRKGLMLIQLNHRGWLISKNLKSRAGYRKRRRSCNTRYRQPRFSNRTGKHRQKLPPSLRHRVYGVQTWVTRLSKWFPVQKIHVEQVKFDMQKMQNPEISGVQYQHGELQGFEVREYLLTKYGRKCVYCDAENVPLNIDHLVARSKGGSNRVSNLVLSCVKCNIRKSNKSLEEFAPSRAKSIGAKVKVPLKDAAVVNATRNEIVRMLSQFGVSVQVSTGAKTKFNRKQFNVPKEHVLDALCTGEVDGINSYPSSVLLLQSTGRGVHARTKPDAYGFPRLRLPRTKTFFGFQTGDLVVADCVKGKYVGRHVGRVACRSTGNFDIKTLKGKVTVNHKYCKIVQRGDGYSGQVFDLNSYPSPCLKAGVSRSTK
jgi:5-methylcytosine-specific restriction endonuclease McrA